nr:hypothetical protein [Tanacetum cinerariifolium]GEY16883.1 hypothetical protein [Tanacetum cinerariifolium]
REGGEHALASTPSEPATRSAGRSTTGTQSRKLSASESAFAEEPVQTTCQMEEPSHLVFETGADDQPIDQTSQLPELFSQPRKPPTPDHTPIDFSNFIMNRLGVDTLTPKLLDGPTYELMRGSCNSLTELEYHLEEVYKVITDQLDWVNPVGQQYPHNLLQPLPLIPDNRGRRFYGFAVNRESALNVYSKRRIIAVTNLKIMEWHNYKHLDWISVRRDDDKIYKFKEGDLKRLRLQDIEDMLLLLVQGKLSNLTVEERFTFNVSLRMTLNDVYNALDDRLKGIRMQYLPTTIWRKGDKDEAAAMIQAIDKILKTRRIMRSLESVEVLRYEKKEKSKKLESVPTEMQLILEHTQQDTMAVVNVNAFADQAPTMAPPTRTDDQIQPHIRWDFHLHCEYFRITQMFWQDLKENA